MQKRIWEDILSGWFAGKIYLLGHFLIIFDLIEHTEFQLGFLEEIKTDLFLICMKLPSTRPFFILIFLLGERTSNFSFATCSRNRRMMPIRHVKLFSKRSEV